MAPVRTHLSILCIFWVVGYIAGKWCVYNRKKTSRRTRIIMLVRSPLAFNGMIPTLRLVLCRSRFDVLSRLDLGIAKEVFAVRAVEEERHVGRDPSRLILVEYRAARSQTSAQCLWASWPKPGMMSFPLTLRCDPGEADSPVFEADGTLDITPL